MKIGDIRENVENLWIVVYHYVYSDKRRGTFHGINYSAMVDIEKALRITVGILRHMERKHMERHPMDSASDQAEP